MAQNTHILCFTYLSRGKKCPGFDVSYKFDLIKVFCVPPRLSSVLLLTALHEVRLQGAATQLAALCVPFDQWVCTANPGQSSHEIQVSHTPVQCFYVIVDIMKRISKHIFFIHGYSKVEDLCHVLKKGCLDHVFFQLVLFDTLQVLAIFFCLYCYSSLYSRPVLWSTLTDRLLKMKFDTLSTPHYADGGLGEVFESTK